LRSAVIVAVHALLNVKWRLAWLGLPGGSLAGLYCDGRGLYVCSIIPNNMANALRFFPQLGWHGCGDCWRATSIYLGRRHSVQFSPRCGEGVFAYNVVYVMAGVLNAWRHTGDSVRRELFAARLQKRKLLARCRCVYPGPAAPN